MMAERVCDQVGEDALAAWLRDLAAKPDTV